MGHLPCIEGHQHSFVHGYCWRCNARQKPLIPVPVPAVPSQPSARWQRRVAQLQERDGHECWVCKAPFTEANPPTIDHVVPLSKEGRRSIENEKLAHGVCNNARGNDDGAAWRHAHKGRPIGLGGT